MKTSLFLAGGLLLASPLARVAVLAQNTVPAVEACCGNGKPVLLKGTVQYFTPPDGPISGADDLAQFREEVYGPDFSVVVPGLPAGKYSVEIQFAEMFATAANMRVMNIAVGNQKLADNFDIFAQAGGGAKVTTVSGTATHPGDAVGGAFTIHFQGVKENAKFNFLSIKDEKNTVVASAYASQLQLDELRLSGVVPVVTAPSIVFDATRSRAARIADLVSRMSLSEKIAQLQDEAPAIPRLNVPRYGYWNEALHGVAFNGHATVFPQAIGLAATWNVDLMGRVADTISTEGRAKYVEAQSRGSRARFQGLTFWSPNINIFRDPRWGRGQETYGEDPFLTSRMGVAFIRGLQGDDPNYLKVMACAKHFAVHSGPESLRHEFDAKVSDQDLHDTYLPAFEAAVKEGRVNCVMSAYNAVNGVPAPANTILIRDTLRAKWGFKGYVVSDCGAITDVWNRHKFVASSQAASALSVKAGTDLECGNDYRNLVSAVSQGLISEAEIDTALRRVLDGRFQLGLFDPPALVKWTKIAAIQNDTPQNAGLALESARQSLVLLKNDGVLPLDKTKINKLAVIGENADAVRVLIGNYNGDPSHPITILQGLRDKLGADNVTFVSGVPLVMKEGEVVDQNGDDFRRAINAAQGADAVIYVGGLNSSLEGEEMNVPFEGFKGGDRTTIELPTGQNTMLEALKATGKPVVYVNCSGSAVAMPWVAVNIPAILQAWYPGESGGTAVADVLFGDANPAGRLPITFYASTSDLPSFTDYSMKGRTYRYFAGKPLWAFGHGLSYTRFTYGAPGKVGSVKSGGNIAIKLAVRNVGARAGDEVVQIYARPLFNDGREAPQRLVGFARVSIGAGQTAPISLQIPATRLRIWDGASNDYRVVPGQYELGIGAASDDIRARVRVAVKK